VQLEGAKVLVNNAGVEGAGSYAVSPEGQARDLFEVNYSLPDGSTGWRRWKSGP
jgi:short-subunit dehydrogenase